jgi:homoserine dehydrogenase
VSSKLKILSSLSFNTFINNNVYVEGINNIDQIDIKNANKLGYKIKLLGISEINNKKLIQRVHPCLVKNTSYIGGINGVLNAVIVNGDPVGENIIQGEGAGPGATTSAIVSDICSILRGNIKYPFSISSNERMKIKSSSISSHIFSSYLRLDVSDKPGVLSDITKILSKNNVSIKRLIQNPFKSKKYSSIIIVTHKVKNAGLMSSISQLSRKKFLIATPKLIRIEF